LANRVKIVLTSNPTGFSVMNFQFQNAAIGYDRMIYKNFITGVPVSVNHVRIGATLIDTVNNLFDSLNIHNLDGNTTFEKTEDGDGVYVNFNVVGVYTLTGADYGYYTKELEDIIVPDNVVLPDLDIKHLSIRIYDTYVNQRILIQELAGATACKLDWDGGDDLYKSIMASKLVFNMLVPQADDAHFLHLFSGDEQRYRVEVVAIDVATNEQLVWQGFLLPDQYNEPYKQVSFFVDFTASDMISSLKGKFLPPWYYENKLPIAQVFAFCLANSGLQQNLLVAPAVVPEGLFNLWQTINVDMRAFIDGEKYKDCYTILEGILASQAMTIYSFRGYWWLEGISRKNNTSFTFYQFDVDGNRIVDVDFNKKLVDCGASLDPTPIFSALTPWKAVNVNFDAKGSNNLFDDNIVNIDNSKLYYSYYQSSGLTLAFFGTIPLPAEFLGVVKHKKWIESLSSVFAVRDFNNGKNLMYGLSSISSVYNYNYTENMAMNNYLECPEKVYVEPGILYELEVNFEFSVRALTSNFLKELKNGYYDKLVPFQVFINDIEKFSNRPSCDNKAELRYVIQESVSDGNQYNLKYSLKFNFKAEIDGFLKFRVLMPILQQNLGGLEDISAPGLINFNKLSLTAVDGYDENKDTKSVRDINFTQELDHDIKLTSTIDNSVINSFGLGYPVNQNYFKVIDRTVDNVDVTTNHAFAPSTILDLDFNTWQISPQLLAYIFEYNKSKTLFLDKASGDKEVFSSVWYGINRLGFPYAPRMGYLKSYTGFPLIPKNYKTYPSVQPDDVLRYMDVQYPAEDFAKRLRWRLWDSTVIDTYPKTVAKALHAVQPEVMFRLEATAKKLLFPTDLIEFYFDNNNKEFIPSRLNLDMFNGKTTFTSTEAKYVELNDITYE
jgi:hypothetical protein